MAAVIAAALAALGGCEALIGADFDEGMPRTGPANDACTGPGCEPASTCGAGLIACGDACVPESISACGNACGACAPPANGNGNATCVASVCGVACAQGYAACDAGCCPERAPVTTILAPTKGWHTCVVSRTGKLKCWGATGNGRLTVETTDGMTHPFEIPGIVGATGAAAGQRHTCATTNGGVACWGATSYAKVGTEPVRDADGGLVPVLIPTQVQGLRDVTGVAAGEFHTCAIAEGRVKCWGRNDVGQLGNPASPTGENEYQVSPVDADVGPGVIAITAGLSHTCALTSGGAVKCWGAVAFPDDDTTSTKVPKPAPTVVLASGVAEIASGFRHNCARMMTTGEVRCWGSNAERQLGIGEPTGITTTPTTVPGIGGALALAAGRVHSCVVTAQATVKCWGNNDEGQLGVGTTAPSGTPLDVAMQSDVATSPLGTTTPAR